MRSILRKIFHHCVGLFITAALLAPTAHALTIGDINVNSAVGEHFYAVVKIGGTRNVPVDQILVSLAPRSVYQRMGVDWEYFHTGLIFDVMNDEGDGAYLRIVSKDVVFEPFIDFVISVRWPSGFISRQYTVLLDMPLVNQGAATQRPVRSASQPDYTAESVSSGTVNRARATPAPVAARTTESAYQSAQPQAVPVFTAPVTRSEPAKNSRSTPRPAATQPSPASKPLDGGLAAAQAELAQAQAKVTAIADAQAAEQARRAAAAQARAKQEARERKQARADAKAKARAEAQAKAEAKARAEAQAKAEAKARAEAQAKAEAKARAEAQAKAEAKARAEAQAKAEAKARAEAQAKADAQAKAEAQTKADAKARAEAQAKAETKARAEAQAKAEASAKAEARAKADALAKARAQADADTKAEARANAEAKAQAKAKAEAAANAAAQRIDSEPNAAESWRFVSQSGDTLWAIARKIQRESGGRIIDIVKALHQNNASAFIGNDANKLKIDARLNVSLAHIKAATPAERRQEIWQDMKDIAEASIAAQGSESSDSETSGKQNRTSALNNEAPALDANNGVLSLVTRDKQAADVSALTRDLSRQLKQSSADAEKQISEGLSKAAAVEGRMDNILAQYEALSEKTTQLKELEATLNRRIAEKAQLDMGLAGADVPLRDLPEKSDGLMRDQEKNLWWWLQLLLGMLFMAALVFVAFNILKRRQLNNRSAYVDQWDRDIMMSQDQLSDEDLAAMVKLKGESIARAEPDPDSESLVLDEGEGAAELQASLYIAYERFDEAEELLNEALSQQPDNHALKSQLLEVYAALGKTEAYQQLAAQLDDKEALEQNDKIHSIR